MPFLRFAAVCLLVLLSALPARANDGVAGLEAGELVFLTTEKIEMAEEDLYLSPDQVRVRYLFRNTTGREVTTLVAFPLPPIVQSPDYGYGFGPVHSDPMNPLAFRLWIDGRELPVAVHARASSQYGLDVTRILQKWQIPLLLLYAEEGDFERMQARLNGLPGPVIEELEALGAITVENYGGRFIMPTWTAHVSYIWTMTIPAGGTAEVRHEYAPVPEAFIFSVGELDGGYMNDVACMDPPFIAAARRMLGGAQYQATTARVLNYILTTANTWAGPIGRFHLTIDKTDPRWLVSLCRDGIRKTGPTTFEWEAVNWRPEGDLSVLFLAPPE
jgi:hypothetical protein